MPAPPPMKISVNAPTNSATPRRRAFSSTGTDSGSGVGRTSGSGTLVPVSDIEQRAGFEVECPHCHKSFSAQTIEGSAARYRGFKCPHCRLFVPFTRAVKQDLLEPLARDPDAIS